MTINQTSYKNFEYLILLARGAIIQYHRQGSLKFIFSQLWKLEVWDQGASMVRVWGKFTSWLATFFLCSHLVRVTGGQGRSLLFLSFHMRALTSSWGPPSFRPYVTLITSWKPHVQMSIPLGIKVSTYKFGGDENIQPITLLFINKVSQFQAGRLLGRKIPATAIQQIHV